MNTEQEARWGSDTVTVIKRRSGLHHFNQRQCKFGVALCGVGADYDRESPVFILTKYFDIDHYEFPICKRCERIFRQIVSEEV